MPKVLGVDFAPLNIPFERRLQTLAALYWTSVFLFFGFGGILLFTYVLFFTRFYFLTIIYLLYFLRDYKICDRGGRRVNWIRNSIIWKLFRDYFPIRLVKTADLDPNKNYVMGYHPHGILSAGAFCNFGTEATGFSQAYPGITPHLLTLKGNFMFPVFRDYVLASGACSVSKESFQYILTKKGKGNAVIVVVGGAAEALDARPHQVTLTLKRRKGFVRMALRTGASLVPVFSFGENDLFDQLPNPEGSILRKYQTIFKNIVGFSPPVFFGRGVFQYTFGYVPHRSPVHTVVGKPIDVEKIDNPTDEEVNKYHEKYIQSLQALFDEYKVKLGDPHKDLTLKLV